MKKIKLVNLFYNQDEKLGSATCCQIHKKIRIFEKCCKYLDVEERKKRKREIPVNTMTSCF